MATDRVQKSLRIDARTVARVEALNDAGESMARTYNRVLVAGVDALEGKDAADAADVDGAEGAHAEGEGKTMQTLAATLDLLTAQLEEKDAQIRALNVIAQQLSGAAPKALESAEQKKTKRGLFSRLFG